MGVMLVIVMGSCRRYHGLGGRYHRHGERHHGGCAGRRVRVLTIVQPLGKC